MSIQFYEWITISLLAGQESGMSTKEYEMEKLPMEEKHIMLGNKDKSMTIFLWHIIFEKKSMGENGEKLKLIDKTCLPFSFNYLKELIIPKSLFKKNPISFSCLVIVLLKMGHIIQNNFI